MCLVTDRTIRNGIDMALDPVDAWVKRLLQMQPASSPNAGAQNLADFYGDLADKVEGVGGAPGIFTFNRSLFVATLAPGFSPDPSAPSWASKIASAWETACGASIITPGTVANPAWTASSVDINTVPVGSSTIITLSAAKSKLQSGLIASANAFKGNPTAGQEAFAKAFLDATKEFQFLTIGLVLAPPAPPFPLPIPTPAQ